MTDTEKLDLILNQLEENNKLLNSILNTVNKDTVGREFLLNLGANILGDFLNNNSSRAEL
jgi:hypothetical protein